MKDLKGKQTVKRISVDEFMEIRLPGGADKLLHKFNGGSFMECHQKIFAEYGVWVEELTSVFQKFDALLAFRNLPVELR